MSEISSSPRLSLLTVDDSQMNHKIVRKMLSNDFDIHSVYSGRECLDFLENTKPQLILLDVTMPDLDGYQTCELIKSNPEFKSIPVLFLSGRCSIEEKLRGYEVGGDDYITKPFDELELAIKIKKAIAVREQNQKLHERAEVATQAVAQAIRVSSSINTCMCFMGKLPLTSNLDDLAALFFSSARELGLATSLHIACKPESKTIFEDGIEKELEIEIFRRTVSDQVFIPIGRRLIVQFAELKLLIKNMPEMDERELETLRSYVLTLLEGFHARWRTLQTEEGVRRQREVLGITVLKAKELIDKMASNFESVMSNSHNIFEEALGAVENQLAEYGLNEKQENAVLSEMKTLLSKMDVMHGSLLEEDHNIVSLSGDLEKVVDAMSKSIERDCGLSGPESQSA